MTYYGFEEDIWKLDYYRLRVAPFICKWVGDNYVKVNSNGAIAIHFIRIGNMNDPFILTTQAKQVFYTTDPNDLELSLVVPMKQELFVMEKRMMMIATTFHW